LLELLELLLAALADNARLDSGGHIVVDRISVHHRPPLDRAQFSPLSHGRRTSRISCTSTSRRLMATCLGRVSVRWRRQPQRCRRWWSSPVLHDRRTRGPMQPSKTQLKVVPCRWRATHAA
jgi:hypothetical protein